MWNENWVNEKMLWKLYYGISSAKQKMKLSAFLSKVNAFFYFICSNPSLHNEYPGEESLFKG